MRQFYIYFMLGILYKRDTKLPYFLYNWIGDIFYTKIFAFFTPIFFKLTFCFFYTKIIGFLHQKIWCKKIGVKKGTPIGLGVLV